MRTLPLARTAIIACIALSLIFIFTQSPLLNKHYERHSAPLSAEDGQVSEQKAPMGSKTQPSPTGFRISGTFDPAGSSSTTVANASETTVSTVPQSPSQEDKIIVIGKLQQEDTDWVAQFLPEWQQAIYTVDNTSHALHTTLNKGREANAYLSYIISNYNHLPSTIAFLHSHKEGYPGGWHTDSLNHDNVIVMKALNIDFVQRNGYANLRCIWIPGCPDEVQPFRDPPKVDSEGVVVESAMAEVWPQFFGSVPVPDAIGTPCCAQFAVSRDQVRKRALSEYQRYHRWLTETQLEDAASGRIFEYLWHVIFGQEPVYCPTLEQCYEDVCKNFET